MSRICAITGKKTVYGNNVSHSNVKTRRRWKVNMLRKKFFLEDENRWVVLKISAKGLKVLNKKGLKKAILDNNGSLDIIRPKKYVGVKKTQKTAPQKKA